MTVKIPSDEHVLWRAQQLRQEGRVSHARQILISHAIQSGSAKSVLALAGLLAGDGDLADGCLLLQTLVELEPHNAEVWARLGQLEQRRGALSAARQAFDCSLAIDPEHPVALAHRSAISALEEAPGVGEAMARRALVIVPNSRIATAALVETVARTRGHEAAVTETLNIFARQASNQPLNDAGPRSVTILEGLGRDRLYLDPMTALPLPTEGHANFGTVLQGRGLSIRTHLIAGKVAGTMSPPAGVLVNAMAEPDLLGEALTLASGWLGERSVINHPNKVAACRRDALPSLLHGIPGLVVPPCYRIEAADVNDRMVGVSAAANQMGWPIIVRPAGAHGGYDPFLVRSQQELSPDVLVSRTGVVYATKYVDCRGPDGLWRKSRYVLCGGISTAEHHYVADHWCVRSRSARALMRSQLMLEDEAARVALDADALANDARLIEIMQRLPLDIAAADVCWRDDGALVLFEVSACINLVTAAEIGIVEGKYLSGPIKKIADNLVHLVEMQAGSELLDGNET